MHVTERPPDPRVDHSRRIICSAALEEFAASGYAGFRMDAVATRAGVGRSTVYRHWKNKGALIVDALRTLNTQPDPARDLPTVSARQQVELLLGHLASALSDSAVSSVIPALIHAADQDPDLREHLHAYSAQRRRRLTDTIASAVSAGEVRAVDPEVASVLLSGAVFYRILMTAEAPDSGDITALVDTVLAP
ncbi:TetR/AcrR family transcriptional regulator [Mycolicibacterium monacense]|uniref:TetR/AcrR family transcriptional regulator n=1 Tax=Mycolicibacterium monacense TaxID=85693 RepID=UPI0007E9FFC7|nr:TetR/AcrR family transcriptional regulator [Mycolicibacterium monacense]OBF49397.1 TetR family transcriptional regulator [Mycolicibacterium monacense]